MRLTDKELELVQSAVAIWEAMADSEADGDITAEEAKRLGDVPGPLLAKLYAEQRRRAEKRQARP